MKKRIIVIGTIVFLFLLSINATAIEVAPRITDREIIKELAEIKIEQANIRGEIKEIRAEIKGLQQQIADTNRRIDELKDGQKTLEGRIDTLIYAVLGCFAALIGSFVALMGFIIWDRRTAISPAIKKNKELEEREDKVEKALKEYSLKEPRLAEILRNVGIM